MAASKRGKKRGTKRGGGKKAAPARVPLVADAAAHDDDAPPVKRSIFVATSGSKVARFTKPGIQAQYYDPHLGVILFVDDVAVYWFPYEGERLVLWAAPGSSPTPEQRAAVDRFAEQFYGQA